MTINATESETDSNQLSKVSDSIEKLEKFIEKTQKQYDQWWNEQVDYHSRLQKSSKDVNEVRRDIKRRIIEYYKDEMAKLLRLRQEELKHKPEEKSSINQSYADKTKSLVQKREKELSVFQFDNIRDIMKNKIEKHYSSEICYLHEVKERDLEEKPEEEFRINFHYYIEISILEQKRDKYIVWLENNQKQQNGLNQKRRDELDQAREESLSKLEKSKKGNDAHNGIEKTINQYFNRKITELQREQKEYFPEFSDSDIDDKAVRKILLDIGCSGIERAINTYYSRKIDDSTNIMQFMKKILHRFEEKKQALLEEGHSSRNIDGVTIAIPSTNINSSMIDFTETAYSIENNGLTMPIIETNT